MWKMVMTGLTLAAAIGGGVATPALAASATPSATAGTSIQEIRVFTGQGTAAKPTTAYSLALSRAQQSAANAGFGSCEESEDAVIEFDPITHNYTVTVTLTCSN
jgi:hypothetical protein